MVDEWLGTYLWMSPEATGSNVQNGYPKGRVCADRSKESADSIFGASDWFSFGIVVWEMWMKQLPHKGLGLATDDEGHLTQQVWVRDSDGKEDRDVIRGNEPAGGGQWTEDLRAVAKAYYHGNRPKIPDDCPLLLSKLMVACWQDNQQDRPSSSFMQKLVDDNGRGGLGEDEQEEEEEEEEEAVVARWLALPALPEFHMKMAYDEFLSKLDL
eukprot:COSAG06_NODE_19483_length_836_cov_1.118046_1_plen_211_part_01